MSLSGKFSAHKLLPRHSDGHEPVDLPLPSPAQPSPRTRGALAPHGLRGPDPAPGPSQRSRRRCAPDRRPLTFQRAVRAAGFAVTDGVSTGGIHRSADGGLLGRRVSERAPCPSDLSDEQWAVIDPGSRRLPSPRPRTAAESIEGTRWKSRRRVLGGSCGRRARGKLPPSWSCVRRTPSTAAIFYRRDPGLGERRTWCLRRDLGGRPRPRPRRHANSGHREGRSCRMPPARRSGPAGPCISASPTPPSRPRRHARQAAR